MSDLSHMPFVSRFSSRHARSLFPLVLGILLGVGAGVGGFFGWRLASRKLTERTHPATGSEVRPVAPTPARKEPPIPMDAIKSCFALSIGSPFDYPDADLIVLPDRRPYRLTATATRIGTLPEGFHEAGPSAIRWEADSGHMQAGPARADRSEALFTPPEDSRLVTVRAILEPAITRSRPGGAGSPVVIPIEKTLRILTPVDSSRMVNGRIDGYEIGQYLDPRDPTIGQRFNVESDWYQKYPDRFSVPGFFHKVDAAWKDLRISPNLSMGFFVIDFPWKTLGMPQYVALDWNLVKKLEDLIDLMRADGRQVSRLVPIYGFRPPAFNLGTIEEQPGTNLKVPFSLHQYGCAVDLIIDEDGDNQLDDLNGDGRIDVHDAAVIMHYVNILDRQYRAQGRMEMVGGAGLYTHNDFVERTQYLGRQTPYIHIDTRGFQRDNGTLIRWPDAWPDGTPIQWSKI